MDARRKKRWRRALFAGLALVAVGAVPTAVLTWLQSTGGERALKAQVLEAAGNAIAGKLEVGSLTLRGQTLHLEGLRLYTPEGKLVAELATLDATVRLRDLALRKVMLDDVKLGAPRLYLVVDERGLNLARAVQAKTPSPSSGPVDWQVAVSGLVLEQGFVEFTLDTNHLVLDGLAAHGQATIALATLGITGALEATAHLQQPLDAPVKLSMSADATKGPTVANAQLTVKDCSLKAHADQGPGEVAIDELVFAPDTMRALLYAWPLQVPLYGKGSLDATHAVVSMRAGTGSLEARSSFKTSPLRIDLLELTGRGLDLQQIIGAPRATLLDLDAKGHLSDTALDTLTGALTLALVWTSPTREPLLTLNAHAEATKGQLSLTPAALLVPGATLSVTGAASLSQLDLSGTLTVTDLAKLPPAVLGFTGLELPPLGGTGALQVRVRGAASHPHVSARGQLTTLRVSTVTAQRLDLDLDLPDVRRPWDTDAILHANRLEVGGRDLDEVSLDLGTRGREFDVALATKGLGDLKVHAAGLLDQDIQGAELNALQLTATNAAWALEAPTHLSWTPAHTQLAPLSLRDGQQRLVLSGQLQGEHAVGALHAENIDLSRLPRVLSPPSLGLSGVFSLDVTADGTLPRPAGQLSFAWTRGELLGVHDVDVRTTATWQHEHLVGHLSGSSAQGNALADFDLPLLALIDRRPEPLSAVVRLSGVDTVRLAPLLGRDLPVQGVLTLEATASGTGEHPVVDATLFAETLDLPLRAQTLTLDTPRLGLKTRADDTLQATLTLSVHAPGVAGCEPAPGSTPARVNASCPSNPPNELSLTLGAPFTLSSLRTHVPTSAELQDTPLTLAVDAKGFDVSQLDALGLVDLEGLAGQLSLSGALTGTVNVPTGALTATLKDGAVPPLKRLDATATLSATEHQATLDLAAALSGKPALTTHATFAANVRELAYPEQLGTRAATGKFTVHSLELASLMENAEGETAPSGTVSGTLDFGGTLEAPFITLSAVVESLKFDKAALGAARLEASGDGTQQKVSLVLAGVGDLQVRGTLGLPLTLTRVRSADAWRESPVSLQLRSKELDVSFLSGVHPMVRLVGGRLDLVGNMSGTLGAPVFLGDAQWAEGRLALFGFGEYRGIELDVEASNGLFELKHLELKAGGGGANLKGKLVRTGEGLYRLTAEGAADKLPIVNDDQLVATTTFKLTTEGDVSPTLIDLASVNLPRVDVELPELKRKDLQDLDRPRDIIVLRGGARASRKRINEARAAGEEKAPTRTLRVVLNAPRNVWVRSSDLNVELGLSEGFRIESTATTQIFGEATILRGNLSVIGREFEVQKGATVRFAGPAAEPWVNLSALHTNEKEQVKVTVTVVGRGTDVSLKATSEPPMPESDIYTLLATGRRELRRGSGASITAEDAVSVVGQLAASQLKTVLAKKLPIDVLNFEASDNFNKLKFDVGKYLSDSVYLGVTAQTGANTTRGENPWAGRLEYQMSRSWSVEAYAGTAPAAGADVVWSRDF